MRRSLMLVLALILPIVGGGAFVPSVRAASPSLTGETLVSGTPVITSADCNPTGTSTFDYTVSGTAVGPYSGTFTESGTATIGSQAGLTGGFNAAPLTSFSAQYSISSSSGVVTGTKQLAPGFGIGECFRFPNTTTNDIAIPIPAGYAATLPDGSRDHGSTTLTLFDDDVNGGVSQHTFTEGYTSSGTVACGVVTTIALSPPAAVDPVGPGATHTVTATVTDNCGNPLAGVTVDFTVTRVGPPPATITGTCTTDSAGMCSFTYAGPILPAEDAITGCAGAGGAPPCGTATKTWVLPVSNPLCTIDITQGAWMIANDGDKVTFGGTVHTDQAGAPNGQEQYTDAPANLDVHSMSILATTCAATLEQADIYGTATENGAGVHLFRIEVTDPDTSGGSDAFWMFLDNYDSGSHPLGGGTVEIHGS